MIPAFLAVSLLFLSIISQSAGQSKNRAGGGLIDNAKCPDIYERYCPQHSGCLQPNSSCNIIGYYPSQDEIKQIVFLHNSKRQEVATGQTKLPSATNMLELEWDDELSKVAQAYANQCIFAHDKANCRRVQNFGVGQNIAMQTNTGVHTLPTPDWKFAVKTWFDEIEYFSEDMVCNFQAPVSKGDEYRHFTQVAWANTFRIGCGYVVYNEGDVFTSETVTRLYVCNYGPQGNVYGTCVYDPGTIYSNCPENTCSGSSCSYFKGLCRRQTNQPPNYSPKTPYLFYCDFQSQSDCDNYIVGNPNWLVMPSLSGNYLDIVLNGGENSTIVFKNKIKPMMDKFCVILKYRKGPTKYTGTMSSDVQEVLHIPEQDYTVSQPLPSYDNPARQQFSTYNLTLSWDMATEFKISFSVPQGASSQFLNVQSILAVNGECQNA